MVPVGHCTCGLRTAVRRPARCGPSETQPRPRGGHRTRAPAARAGTSRAQPTRTDARLVRRDSRRRPVECSGGSTPAISELGKQNWSTTDVGHPFLWALERTRVAAGSCTDGPGRGSHRARWDRQDSARRLRCQPAGRQVRRRCVLRRARRHRRRRADYVIAESVGVRREPDRSPLDSLIAWLGDRHVLVVLDNCEEIVDTVRRSVEVLVSCCPNLHIVVTSRGPLGVRGCRTAWRARRSDCKSACITTVVALAGGARAAERSRLTHSHPDRHMRTELRKVSFGSDDDDGAVRTVALSGSRRSRQRPSA